MTGDDTPRYVFQAGDHALFIDRKGRRYLIKLTGSGTFHTHLGNFDHADVIGKQEGLRVATSRGHLLLALKPTMADYTRLMPRIATVIYPKDLGAIVTLGDIFPGARVLEAGTGSGALTIALARAVGEEGRVLSYDVRQDMIDRAEANVDGILPHHPQLSIKLGDVSEGLDEGGLDRITLDLPEPWHVVPHATEALVPGGIFLSFLPTVLQVHDLVQALENAGTFDVIETVEVLLRPWSVGRRSVRPAHRMVAHTGFITTARRCTPSPRREEPEQDGDRP
jgi:tRNA (adenine57-N1/adenine58-N1)-methyltransferase